MPYRRLPNTDAARLKAMKDAISKSMSTSPFHLAFSHQSLQRLKSFQPLFEQAMQRNRHAYKNQVEKSKAIADLSRKARLYISHFLQVMNFMILRGELPQTARKYYSLPLNSNNLPTLSSDKDLLEWGKKVIDGDFERQKAGGKMVTNPTAAVVRVHYENFAQALSLQKNLQKISAQTLDKLSSMREEADKIILSVWNEVESSFDILSDDEKRNNATEYGIKYVYRPHEKAKKFNLAEERIKRFSEAGSKKGNNIETEEETSVQFNFVSVNKP